MADAVPKLVLASASPRRVGLLRQIGMPFEQLASPDSEPRPNGAPPQEYVQQAAAAKARAVARLLRGQGRDGSVVLGADTMVFCAGQALGKPCDRADAARMLSTLSAREHQVFTGLALIANNGEMHSDWVETRVTMVRLSERDIEGYIASKEPLDKAGAYGIQGLGARFIERIEGCYYNVVGLPLARLCAMLEALGWDMPSTN